MVSNGGIKVTLSMSFASSVILVTLDGKVGNPVKIIPIIEAGSEWLA